MSFAEWDPHKCSSTIRITGSTAVRTGDGGNSRSVLTKGMLSRGGGEWKVKCSNQTAIFGVGLPTTNVEKWLGANEHSWGFDGSDGQKAHGRWSAYTGLRAAPGDVVTIKIDNHRNLTFCINGRSAGVAFKIQYPLKFGVSLKVGGSVTIMSSHTAAAPAPQTPIAAAVGDEWGVVSTTMTASGPVVRRTGDGTNSRVAIGRRLISSGRATWTLSGSNSFIAGIMKAGSTDVEHWLGSTSDGYGYDGGDGQKAHKGNWSSYGTPFGSADKVEVTMDLDRREVSFAVNGRPQGRAFGLPAGWSGHVAVATAVGVTVTITHFSGSPAAAGAGPPAPRTPRSTASPVRSSDTFNRRSNTIDVVAGSQGRTVKRVRAGGNSRSALGSAKVVSGTATWKVKLNAPCIVGIATDACDLEKWAGATNASYGYDGTDGQKCHVNWSAYASRFTAGSVVSVKLDLNRGTLEYEVNGRSLGVAWSSIHADRGPYCLAVSLSVGNMATIESFEQSATAGPAVSAPAPAPPPTRTPAASPAPAPSGPTTTTDHFQTAKCSSLIIVRDGGSVADRTAAGNNSRSALGSLGFNAGLVTWKVKVLAGPVIIGLGTAAMDMERWAGAGATSWGYDGSDGQLAHDSWKPYARRYSTGDVVSVIANFNNRQVSFAVNGSSLGVAARDLLGDPVFVAVSLGQHRRVQLLEVQHTHPPAVVIPPPRAHAPPPGPVPTPAAAPAPAPPARTQGLPEGDAWNPSAVSSTMQLLPGNLIVKRTQSGSNSRCALGTTVLTSGLGRWKVKLSGPAIIGVATPNVTNVENYLGSGTDGWAFDGGDGQRTNGRWSSYTSRFSAEAVVDVIANVTTGTLSFAVNGVDRGVAYTNLAGHQVCLGVALSVGQTATILECVLGDAPPTPADTTPLGHSDSIATHGVVATPLKFDPARSYDGITLTDGRAELARAERGHSRTAIASVGYSSGRHAWNVAIESEGVIVGAAVESTTGESYLGASGGYGYDGKDGQLAHKGAWSYYGPGFVRGDVVTVVVDFTSSTIEYLVNGSHHGIGGSDIGMLGTLYPAVSFANVGNAASLRPVEVLPSPARTLTRRASSSVASPEAEAAAAMNQLASGSTSHELSNAIGRLHTLAKEHRDVLSWEAIVKVVHQKRESPSFPADQWTTDVAKAFGALLRMVKLGQ